MKAFVNFLMFFGFFYIACGFFKKEEADFRNHFKFGMILITTAILCEASYFKGAEVFQNLLFPIFIFAIISCLQKERELRRFFGFLSGVLIFGSIIMSFAL